MPKAPHRLLVVGPLPPPIAGTSVSFQIFCREVANHPQQLQIDVINSAPKHLGQYPLFTRAHFETAQRIMQQLLARIRAADQLLIFGPDQFLMSLAALSIQIAGVTKTPCYVRAFGGSLDCYYQSRPTLWRRFFQMALARADGLIVETALLHRYFTSLIGNKVHYVPGYRPISSGEQSRPILSRATGSPLRTVFIGHIREEKGVFDLLNSLQQLETANGGLVQCDLFGPIYSADSHRFQQALAQTPNAVYRGLLEPEGVIPMLRRYDALVFPTHYAGEGHPGVIIEAMMAGTPVVTTRFRSIPEIIHEGENGLLVAPNDAAGLAQALRTLATDRARLMELGRCNWEMRTEFSAAHQVPRILAPLGIQIS